MASEPGDEGRIARLEGATAELRGRLDAMDDRFNRLEDRVANRMNGFEDRVSQISERRQTNFQWTVGIVLGTLIPVWVTIILAVLFTR